MAPITGGSRGLGSAVDTTGPVGEPSAADWQRIVATHVHAPLMLCTHAVAVMAPQRGGAGPQRRDPSDTMRAAQVVRLVLQQSAWH